MTDQTPADAKISELNIENEQLKAEVASLKVKVDDQDKQLKTANDVIEAGLKAKLSARIISASKYTKEDCARMGVDELQALDRTLNMVLPTYKSIRGAATATGDEDNPLNKLYAGKK